MFHLGAMVAVPGQWSLTRGRRQAEADANREARQGEGTKDAVSNLVPDHLDLLGAGQARMRPKDISSGAANDRDPDEVAPFDLAETQYVG